MRFCILASAVWLLTSPPANAQWLEDSVAVGDGPRGLCYNPQYNKVYCANYGSGDVAVIDGEGDSVVATVAAGYCPRALCYNPENNKLYCANEYGSSVTIIDGAGNQVLRTITVGSSPIDFCHNPLQNRVYVANQRDSSISGLRDSGGVGIEEGLQPTACGSRPEATVVRGVLRLPPSHFSPHSSLFDLTGRAVMSLAPGSNDVRHLSPGVYFVRRASGVIRDASSVTKIMITR